MGRISVLVFALFLVFIFNGCEKSLQSGGKSLTANFAYNLNIEEGSTIPKGWVTKNQFLNEITGWDTKEVHSGKHSLKIENIGKTDAYWQGAPIVFNKLAYGFTASVWTKVLNVKGKDGKYRMMFKVYLKSKDNSESMVTSHADISLKEGVWQNVKENFYYNKPISKVVPFFLFSGFLGSAWFDDFSLLSIKEGINLSKFSDIVWKIPNFSPKFSSNKMIIKGEVLTPYHYLFTLPQKRFKKGEHLVVNGVINKGSIVVGLLDANRKWFYQKIVSNKGPFSVKFAPSTLGSYIPIVTANLSVNNLGIDLEVLEIKFEVINK